MTTARSLALPRCFLGPLLTSSSKRGESLVLAMQELLQLACGLSHEDSKLFTLHTGGPFEI